MDQLQKPSVGRIVHYTTAKGTVRPAIIVQVWGDTPTSACNLNVFVDWQNDQEDPELARGVGTGMAPAFSRSQSDDGQPKPGHWHFPPRV